MKSTLSLAMVVYLVSSALPVAAQVQKAMTGPPVEAIARQDQANPALSAIGCEKTTDGWMSTLTGHAFTVSLQPERRPLSLEAGSSTGALKYAIALEAERLAQSSPASERRVEAQQPASRDDRAWCLKHTVGCGALIGFGVGFIGGLVHPVHDFSRFGWAMLFSGPLGAGIGAVVGVGAS
jgi:hypothetical protein